MQGKAAESRTPLEVNPPPSVGAHSYQGVPGDRHDETDPLGHIQLFARLGKTERAELFSAMTTQEVPANQTVFWLGDKGEIFFLVESGEVAVTVPNERGEHVTLNTLGPGGFFGEISLLDGGPRTATIRTTEPTKLFMLSRSALHDFLFKRPDVAIEILTVMGQRQRASTEQLRAMKNPNEVFEARRMTLWQKISDVIASTAASQWFTLFHITWFGIWIALNAAGALFEHPPGLFAFDPFPFGLLTMVVSLEAIFLSIFVMVSQNRQSEKDRVRTDLDYQVNVKAQTEIMGIARKLDQIEGRIEALARTDDKPPG